MNIVRLSKAEFHEMLYNVCAAHGVLPEEVAAEWDAGTLDDPNLRDLWLIWGDDFDPDYKDRVVMSYIAMVRGPQRSRR